MRNKQHETKNTVSGKKKSVKELVESDNQKMKELMVLELGYEIKGEIKEDDTGLKYIDAELDAVKWGQPEKYAVEIGALAAKINDFQQAGIKYVPRLVQKSKNVIAALLVLKIPANNECDEIKTKTAVKQFVAKTAVATTQEQLETQQAIESEQVVDKDVEKQVSDFLEAHGGKSLRTSISVLMGDEQLAKIDGTWKNVAPNANPEDNKKTIEGKYDGRRLRKRFFYIQENGKKARIHEIYYDDVEFDKILRDLKDNKEADIQAKCNEMQMGKKTRLVLEDLIVKSRL